MSLLSEHWYIVKIFYKIYNKFLYVLRTYRNFYIPNLKVIFKKEIILSNNIRFQQPVYVTGLGKVKIGENVSFGYSLGGFYRWGCIEIQPRYKNSYIEIGNNVATNNNILFCAASKIIIGEETLIGQYVTFLDHDAHGIEPDKRRTSIGNIGDIEIGRNVWIGNNVMILTGTKIGNNSVVATGSVVKGSFPENVIIGGVPAKIIKTI